MQQAGVNSVETFNATDGEAFRERADAFLREAATRRRDPVKTATLPTPRIWQYSSRSWRIFLYQLLSFQLNPEFSRNLGLHRGIVCENLLFAAGANDQGRSNVR